MSCNNENMKFAIDRMLIKLGVYLRVIGYDTIWDLSLPSIDVVHIAIRENRIFLTQHKSLHEHTTMPARWFLIRENNPVVQFRMVVAKFKLDTCSNLFTRCLLCNSLVEVVDDKNIINMHVPPLVRKYNKKITRCPFCNKFYWHGMHVENTIKKLELN